MWGARSNETSGVLVGVKGHERRIEEKGRPLAGHEEEQGEEGVCDVFWQDELTRDGETAREEDIGVREPG